MYDNDQWSLGDIITSSEDYQIKLLQKRHEMSVQHFGRHDLPRISAQSRIPFQNSCLLCEEWHEKDREIQRLTLQLEATNKELQDTKQHQIGVTNALQQDIQTNERQVQQLLQELQEKQQTEATLKSENENKERLLQQLTQEQEGRRQQQLQNSQERDIVLRQELQLLRAALQQTEKANITLQQQRQQLEDQSYWVVRREEIKMTVNVLGKGGWGVVKVATFRGLRVAAKCLHEVILSPYNISVFSREMEIAARVRHPNLLQFIGATREGTPIILLELMATSLRREIEKSPLNRHQIIRIANDISAALNYLHLWQPDPILHRDVSSPNVLLEPYGLGIWKAKLSDYGSANIVQSISANSVAPGNPFYSAPEAPFPDQHSPAMDVFSFGVLLMEMILCQPPASKTADKMTQSENIQWPAMKRLVQRCISRESQVRPSIAQVLIDLEDM